MLKLSGVELFQEIEILAAGYPTKNVKKNSAQSHNINIKNVYWTENQKVKINKDMHLYITQWSSDWHMKTDRGNQWYWTIPFALQSAKTTDKK